MKTQMNMKPRRKCKGCRSIVRLMLEADSVATVLVIRKILE